ncbi:hypothetical protein [Egicoccus sp. AB-alg2]|uniref:hypothetical protein n=1 Tax=Egicoccus sp. AB-alg2 TaxID=3242693 RepID=UPI00359D84A7
MQFVARCRRNGTLVAAAMAGALAVAAVAPAGAWAQETEEPTEQVAEEDEDDLGGGEDDPADEDDGAGEGSPEPTDGEPTDGEPTDGEPTDEEDDVAADPAVVCDAELITDDGDEFYWFEPGQAVSCVAEGLDPAVDAEWGVEIFGVTLGDLEDDAAFEEPSEVYGATVTPAEDGTIAFDFAIPGEVVYAEVYGVVAQGEPGAETYLVEFEGFALGDFEFTIGSMDCPDPVTAGSVATCTAQEMEPGEFVYGVQFFSVREIVDYIRDLEDLLEDLDGTLDEDLLLEDLPFGEPDVVGAGEAGEDGVGSFAFTVPANRALDFYVSLAFQDGGYVAVSAGEIVPAAVGGGNTGGTPSTGSPKPVAVPRPNRVEAGAGGAAPADGGAGLIALAGLAGVGGLLLRRRLAGR